MPLITFGSAPNPSEAEIFAVIEGVIGMGRPIELTYNFDLGIIFSVNLPDATQTEADAVQAALASNFPSQTAGSQAEPHALLCMLDAAPQVWTNMPAALTEFRSSPAFRAGCSMKKVEQVRLVVNVLTVGAAAAVLAAQWSTGGAFAFFEGSGPSVGINVLGFRVSPWINVPSGARADGVAMRIVGSGGDGVLDPGFGQILLEGR